MPKKIEGLLHEKHFDFQNLVADIHRAVTFFGKAFPLGSEVNPNGKTSAILVYKSTENTVHHLKVGFGEIEYDTRLKTALRKIVVLETNPLHLTNFGSRDGILDWGGAYNLSRIFLGKIALSGLTEKGDDACLLAPLVHQRYATPKFVTRALTETKNEKLYNQILEGISF